QRDGLFYQVVGLCNAIVEEELDMSLIAHTDDRFILSGSLPLEAFKKIRTEVRNTLADSSNWQKFVDANGSSLQAVAREIAAAERRDLEFVSGSGAVGQFEEMS